MLDFDEQFHCAPRQPAARGLASYKLQTQE
jgi:hypothetical protein